MRKITEIIVHCTATVAGKNVSVEQIDACHKARGFKSIGYHYVIDLDGNVQRGRDIAEPGAHCIGHNSHSIGICYVGGLDSTGKPADTRTPLQKQALRNKINELKQQYPHATIHGHNEFSAKACPCFDVKKEL